MNPEMDQLRNRREFLRTVLRAAALAGLAFAGVFLGWKSSTGTGEDASCGGMERCGECPKLARCKAPEAVEARRPESGMRP